MKKRLVESLKVLENKLDKEGHKRIPLEQYGKREVVEVGGIKAFEGENCEQPIYEVCKLAKTNIKNGEH